MSIDCSRGHANIKLCDTGITDRLPNSMSFVRCKERRGAKKGKVVLLVTDAYIESSSPPLNISARRLWTKLPSTSAGHMVGW